MAIIGISGKVGSGKDLVGKIIQYLTAEDVSRSCYANLMTNKSIDGYNNSNWKIVKFADKLKDIICILIGCTREQLEDREFKEKELGEEWWFWKLERDGGYKTILLPYNTTENVKSFQLIKLTPRLLLQLIGTDLFRNQLHPKVWVNATMVSYKKKLPQCSGQPDFDWIIQPQEDDFIYPNWIITDVRFPNELQEIKDKKGVTIRINRLNSSPQTIYVNKKERTHPSETALDNAKFDYIIDNNGTIEELIEKVKEILIKEKIL